MKQQKIIEEKLKELKDYLLSQEKYDIHNKPLYRPTSEIIEISIQIDVLKWVLNQKRKF